VLGQRRVGAGQQDAVVGEVAEGRPDLLAVDAPRPVVLPLGLRAQRGEVGARRRLGEQLAPDVVGAQQPRQVALLLLGRAVGDDRRPAHADADVVDDLGDAQTAALLGDDRVLHRRTALAAMLLGPRHADETAVVQHLLVSATTLLHGGEVTAVVVGAVELVEVIGEVLADRAPPLRFLRCVVEVHAGAPRVGAGSVAIGPAAR